MQVFDFIVTSVKWLSQFVILISAASAVFHELYTKDPITGRRRLTRSGRAHVLGIVLGFVAFGVTEIRDQRKAANEREDAKVKAEQQEAQIKSLKAILAKQEDIATAQKTVIDNQVGQNVRLKDLLLASYQLSAIEVTVDMPSFSHSKFAGVFQRTRDDFKASGEALPQLNQQWQYFETCLEHGEFQANKGERDQWKIDCSLNRPMGTTSPVLYCPPESYQWRSFEGLLDLFFGPLFTIKIKSGPDLFVINSSTRPVQVIKKGTQLKLTALATKVKIGQLSHASILIRMDKAAFQKEEFFNSVRIRSLDPLVKFDTTIHPNWSSTKVGTVVISIDGEPQERDVIVQVAGPTALPVQIDRRLLAVQQL